MVQVKKRQELASRLRLDVVVPTKADASSSLDRGVFEKESFDRVLLDAPCSALGLRPSLRVGGASAWCASKSTTSLQLSPPVLASLQLSPPAP
jgi:hypothetical protein